MSVESQDQEWLTAARPIVPATLSVRLLATVHTLPPQAPARWRWRGASAAACMALAAGVALAVYLVREPAAPLPASRVSTTAPASTTSPTMTSSHAPTTWFDERWLAIPSTVAEDPRVAVAARHQVLGVPLRDFHQQVACAGCHGSSPITQTPPSLPKTCIGCHPASHGKRFVEKQCRECHRTTTQPYLP